MTDEITDIESLLKNWFISHPQANNDFWFFEMIVSLNAMELLDFILCMYIWDIERGTLNFNYDDTFGYLLKRVRTEILGNTIVECRDFVLKTKEHYGDLYKTMLDVLINHMELYVKHPNKRTAYQNFAYELYETFRGDTKHNLKDIFGRYLERFRKEI